MLLRDAQKAVERIFNRVMTLPYGVDVRYARGCKRGKYIVTVNNWHGEETQFSLHLAQLLDSEKVKAKLTVAFVQLEARSSQ